jgi:hypothetical protein
VEVVEEFMAVDFLPGGVEVRQVGGVDIEGDVV